MPVEDDFSLGKARVFFNGKELTPVMETKFKFTFKQKVIMFFKFIYYFMRGKNGN